MNNSERMWMLLVFGADPTSGLSDKESRDSRVIRWLAMNRHCKLVPSIPRKLCEQNIPRLRNYAFDTFPRRFPQQPSTSTKIEKIEYAGKRFIAQGNRDDQGMTRKRYVQTTINSSNSKLNKFPRRDNTASPSANANRQLLVTPQLTRKADTEYSV